MIYPNKPLYLPSLLGYVYYLTYYTLTTKDNILSPFFVSIQSYYTNTLTPVSARAFFPYSTVTLFARFLGLSTSNPLATLT